MFTIYRRFYPSKVTQKSSRFLKLKTNLYLCVVPGCFDQKIIAEIKPVEPDQDNACAGKDESVIPSFPVFVN